MFVRHPLTSVPHDYHGAIDFAELAAWGIDPDQIIDFSVNSNPFGPSEGVLAALQRVPVARYPDKACLALRDALAERHQRPLEEILVGNGTAEILWLVSFAVLQPGDRVLVIGPTFGEYARNSRLMGAQIEMWQARPVNDFELELDQIEAKLEQLDPKIFFLCNPNNPTGRLVDLATIERWTDRFRETLFVIDEAYIQFLDQTASAVELLKQNRTNLLVLRSMTKDYALAGLRLGYVIGSRSLIRGLSAGQIPWSVNGLAQAAGLAALSAEVAPSYQAAWAQLREVAAEFRAELNGLGFRPVPSETHYFLMPVGDGRAWRETLLTKGLLVRLCESYGLPAYVRISTQTPEENRCLLNALRS